VTGTIRIPSQALAVGNRWNYEQLREEEGVNMVRTGLGQLGVVLLLVYLCPRGLREGALAPAPEENSATPH
jgi:hypothetical protein